MKVPRNETMKKPLRNFLLFIAAGFLIIWIAEFQRTDLAHSYWLALLAIISFLTFQYLRLTDKANAAKSPPVVKAPKTTPKKRK